jgi:outer membrane receptor protein involved in Fe transport
VASGSINYLAQGMFNLALAEGRFALRGVVSYQNDGGWIDHATQGKDYNSYAQKNARLMASWAPSDKVRLDVTYLEQDSDLDSASNAVSSPDFDNPFITDIFARQFLTFEQDIFNVTLSLDLGFADLTSSTSYMEKDWVSRSDYGPLPAFDSITTQEFYLGNVVGLPIGFGDLSSQLHDVTYATEPTRTKNWFQEFRLISKDNGPLDWIAGLFYADAEAYWDAWRRIWGIENAVNALAPGWGTLLYPDDAYLFWNQQHDATEIALYGELGVDLSREWKLTLGGRYDDFEKNSPMWYTAFGVRTASDPETFTMNVFAPKVSLAYRPNSGLMWYGLVSRGYRTGGPNGTYIAGNPDPNPDFMYYDSDNLWNYETGIRKAWADGRVTTDVTLFYLDWSDVQLEARFWDPVAGAFVNAIFNTRSAHSLGVEAQISAQLGRGFSVTSAITWDEAELDEDTPPIWDGRNGVIVSVPAGSELPATPAWSTATTLQYDWDNARLGFPYIALDHFYKDTYVTYLQDQSGVPSYNLFRLRLGTTLASGLDLTLAIRNLTDERSPTLFWPGGNGNFIPGIVPPTWNITKPRSISLTVQKNF